MAIYIDDLIDEEEEEEGEDLSYFVDLKALVESLDDVESSLEDEEDEAFDF